MTVTHRIRRKTAKSAGNPVLSVPITAKSNSVPEAPISPALLPRPVMPEKDIWAEYRKSMKTMSQYYPQPREEALTNSSISDGIEEWHRSMLGQTLAAHLEMPTEDRFGWQNWEAFKQHPEVTEDLLHKFGIITIGHLYKEYLFQIKTLENVCSIPNRLGGFFIVYTS
jgi:hypothetical protein